MIRNECFTISLKKSIREYFIVIFATVLLALVFQIRCFASADRDKSQENNSEQIFTKEEWSSAITFAEISRLYPEPESVKRLRKDYILGDNSANNSSNSDQFKGDKKWLICGLLGTGYNKEAQQWIRKLKWEYFFTKKVQDKCSKILDGPIINASDIDNKWIAYSVAKDIRYIEMIVGTIKKLMDIPSVTKEDLQYISFIMNISFITKRNINIDIDDPLKLENILNKAKTNKEKREMELGIRSLFNFGHKLTKIPMLKKQLEEGKAPLNNKELQNQLKMSHYLSYCTPVASGGGIWLFPAKKGASKGDLNTSVFKNMKHLFKKEEGELVMIQAINKNSKIEPKYITIITPTFKIIKSQFFAENNYIHKNQDKENIIAEFMPINSKSANEKGVYIIFHEKSVNSGNVCTYFYKE